MGLKSVLLTNKIFEGIYVWLADKYVACLTWVSPVRATKYVYKKTIGKPLNIQNPQDLNEKLQWLKLNTYNNNDLVTECVDKLRMHEYLSRKQLQEYCVPILGAWDNVDEIDWDALPDSFALKCNHGCAYNIICHNKSELDIEDAKRRLTKWLREKYWTRFAETQYRYVNPKIICEKYIDFNAGGLPIDYKIHCVNGKPIFTLICSERESHMKMCCVDNDYNLLDIIPENNDHFGGVLPNKPELFEKMLEIATIISQPFPFVRVDLYTTGQKIYVGELTFLPQGGLIKYYRQSTMDEIGEMIKL